LVDERYAIREAEAEDWVTIATLLGRSPEAARELRRWLQSEYEQHVVLLAEETAGREPAGGCVAGLERGGGSGSDERNARIVWIGVAPPHRRRGLGKRLLAATLDELRSRQVRRASVVLEGTDVEAMALFRSAEFASQSQQLGLVRPTAAPALSSTTGAASIRPLGLDDVPLLAGLLIRLGLERAEAIHDQLEALTPSQVESWLQQPGTPAFAAWEPDDPTSPLGLAWASRRRQDAVLRYVGVEEDSRRQGIGSALLSALIEAASSRGAPPVPLRLTLTDPGEEAAFFRASGFEVERVTHTLSRTIR
jgi:GNAT superfamily N-acetyltransferase